MNLSDLRPTQQTELDLLSASLRGSDARAAVPSALSERFLISVARDLRMLEQNEDDAPPTQYLAAPLMLVFLLYTGAKTNRPREFTIGENALYQSLQVYQWAVEREIVTRLVGAGGKNDESALFAKLNETRLASS